MTPSGGAPAGEMAGAKLLAQAPDPEDVLERVLRLRAVDVLERARHLIGTLPVPISHRELLEVHLEEGRAQVARQPDLHAIQLPMLVYEDATGSHEPAAPLAAACLLLYLGADLFDAAVDNELPDCWQGRTCGEVHLAAATLLAALPTLALDELARDGVPADRVWRLGRDFATTLAIMSAGEHADLSMEDRDDVALDECRRMVERKAGAEVGLFTRAGALLATDDAATVQAYWEFGVALGSAGTIASDAADIWHATPSQDLLNGKRALTVTHALAALEGTRLDELRELLSAARQSPDVHDGVRALLVEAGSLRHTALTVGAYKQRAVAALERAGCSGPARRQLRAYLERFFVTRVADFTLPNAESFDAGDIPWDICGAARGLVRCP